MDPVDECVEWTGTRIRYGRNTGRAIASIPKTDTAPRRVTTAARAVWEQHYGPIAQGLVIRHTCDNPGCVRLSHLQIGTPAQNSRDMIERGRHRNGSSV